MSGQTEVIEIRMEPFFQPTDFCCICDAEVVIYFWQQNYAIAMYEGLPVPNEWDGDWGGFTACKECFDKHERGELPRWGLEELRRSASYQHPATGGQGVSESTERRTNHALP